MPPVELHYDIAAHDGAIHGRISDALGRTIAFRGWLELAGALEALAHGPALSAVADPAAPPAPPAAPRSPIG